jgi:hypothetical protein
VGGAGRSGGQQLNTEEQTIWLQDQLKQHEFQTGRRLIWLSTPSLPKGRMAVMQHELSRRALSRAGRAMGTNRAMARLQSDLAQIEQLADPIPAPPVLVIDEVLPSPSPSAAIPRFAQLSCLRRHRPR